MPSCAAVYRQARSHHAQSAAVDHSPSEAGERAACHAEPATGASGTASLRAAAAAAAERRPYLEGGTVLAPPPHRAPDASQTQESRVAAVCSVQREAAAAHLSPRAALSRAAHAPLWRLERHIARAESGWRAPPPSRWSTTRTQSPCSPRNGGCESAAVVDGTYHRKRPLFRRRSSQKRYEQNDVAALTTISKRPDRHRCVKNRALCPGKVQARCWLQPAAD